MRARVVLLVATVARGGARRGRLCAPRRPGGEGGEGYHPCLSGLERSWRGISSATGTRSPAPTCPENSAPAKEKTPPDVQSFRVRGAYCGTSLPLRALALSEGNV